MIVGLLSDTHDHLPLIDVAIKQLNEMNVGLLLHAGDYISPFVTENVKQLKAPLIGVFGNNDGDRTMLNKKFAELGADIRGRFAFVLLDGMRIALQATAVQAPWTVQTGVQASAVFQLNKNSIPFQ